MNANLIQKIKTAPKEPGVYIFRNGEKVLYVGKAVDLRARLKSYLKITDIKTQSLHEEADRLEYIPLRSDIEALIEEAKLIKSLRPRYNVVLRDDTSYLYVSFTKENYPRVFIGHKKPKVKDMKMKREMIGPFTDSGALYTAMKLIRRQLPYCSCAIKHLRDCLNAQIGKCAGFCCNKNFSDDAAKISEYRNVIRRIKMILKGQSQKLLNSIQDKDQRMALESIFAHKPYVYTETLERKNYALVPTAYTAEQLPAGMRVECYDNSNFAGKEAVGAMTALVKTETGWESDKNRYRKFRIRWTPTRDDPRMIGELIARRLNHPEWPYPDLIIIDGGITQYRAAKKMLDGFSEAKKVRLISFAKPHKLVYGLRPNDISTPFLELPKELQEVIERAIYQTHNFVIRYHRQVRNRAFIPAE